MSRVDYDRIATLYDEPGRDHEPDRHLAAFLEDQGPLNDPLCVLDVGCGTGKQLTANAVKWPVAHYVGVDRFGAMLRIAQLRCSNLEWVQGDGARLPFCPETFHYVASQFSYPHIGRTRELLFEVFRVLRPQGRFVMTNIDPWLMPGWLIYRYFPEAKTLDYQDFVPTEQFVTLMVEAGFERIRVSRTDLSRDERLDRFQVYVADRHRASQLMAISDDAYEQGVQALRESLAKAGLSEMVERSEFVLVTIIGDKNPAQPTA